MYKTGQKVKIKATRSIVTIVGPSDRAFHGVHNFWIVQHGDSDSGMWQSTYSAKEIEAI